MSRLEEIKNEYAIRKGFKDFWQLYYSSNFAETKDYIFEMMQQYASECVKASLERANSKEHEMIQMLEKAAEKLYLVENPSTSCRILADDIVDLINKTKTL